MRYLRSNGYSIGVIAVVAWIANYLHFMSFGLYSDDWFYAGFAYLLDARVWIGNSLWGQLSTPANFNGRPLQLVFCYMFAELGALANSFAVNYLIAFLLFAGSGILVYEVLRHRFSKLLSVLAAVLFVLSPLYTLHQFLNGQYSFGPPFIMVFGAMALYLRGKRRWSYLVAPLSLLCYESIFFLFLGTPLLCPGKVFKGRRREWLVHVVVSLATLACYLGARGMLHDPRVTEVKIGMSLIWAVLHSWIHYTFFSFAMYLYAALRVREASIEAYVYLVLFCALLAGLFWLYRKDEVDQTPRTTETGAGMLQSAGIGFVFLALGYVVSYFVFQEPSPGMYLTDRSTRISVAASFGSSFVMACILAALIRMWSAWAPRFVACICVCGFLGVQFLYSFVIQDDYVRDWSRQRDYIMQCISLTPDVQPDSVLILRINPGNLKFFLKGRHRPGIGMERHLFEDVFSLIYTRSQPAPTLFVVYSDDWVKYLKQDPDGFMSWTQPIFPGRWFPSKGRYRPGRFIVFQEIQPGWIVRRSDPILVNGVQIVQKASADSHLRPLWGILPPTRLMPKLLPDFAWRSEPADHFPTVVSGVPENPTATPQTFTFTGRDQDGYTDIYRMYFLINTTPTIPQNTCHGFYDRATNSIYLYDDAVKVAMGPLVPGSAGTLQNSQCSVHGKTSSLVSAAGTDVAINLGLGLKPTYAARTQNIYFWTQDMAIHNTGWVQTGTWKIP